jgi:hypothetical protein
MNFGPCDNPMFRFNSIDPEQTCYLFYVYDQLLRSTSNLKDLYTEGGLKMQRGLVRRLQQSSADAPWKLSYKPHILAKMRPVDQLTQDLEFEAERVFITTGCDPISLKYHEKYSKKATVIDLHTALTPTMLRNCIEDTDKVVVIGGSHSAALVLKNLVELKHPPQSVVNLTRARYIYAEYFDEWIRYDNTGLKGEAARFMKDVLEAGKAPLVKVHVLQKDDEENVLQKELADATKIIYAVGYSRTPLPSISIDGSDVKSVDYDKFTGSLKFLVNGTTLEKRRAYGYGIAFPEQVTDREGRVEMNVGLIKFMRYMQRVIPEHLQI